MDFDDQTWDIKKNDEMNLYVGLYVMSKRADSWLLGQFQISRDFFQLRQSEEQAFFKLTHSCDYIYLIPFKIVVHESSQIGYVFTV